MWLFFFVVSCFVDELGWCVMSDVIAKNELKNIDSYEFDAYEDKANDEIVDKIEDLIFGKDDKKGSDFLKALWKLREDMYRDEF